jgi:hypothetical protein
LLLSIVLVSHACMAQTATTKSSSLSSGLLLALAEFEVNDNGRPLPKMRPAKVLMLVERGGTWTSRALLDPESNVFHKAMVYQPPGAAPGILTAAGNAAAVKLWRLGPQGFTAETIWETTFGGTSNRMRDIEVGDLAGEGTPDLAVATHDQGVVAVVRPRSGGAEVIELDRRTETTFVHEVEIGDLYGEGDIEIYATVSTPNRLDSSMQSGSVFRYTLAPRRSSTELIDLGERHSKEILVADVDGNGRDELYVVVEALTGGKRDTARLIKPVEIWRYEMSGGELKGTIIATLNDSLCRVLTAGDVDGDGKKELVAAPFRSGLWLLRPGPDPSRPWGKTSIDRDSASFEHASLLTDLDGDGKDELYVANDEQGEVLRYVLHGDAFTREVIYRYEHPASTMTWSIMPVPAAMIPE